MSLILDALRKADAERERGSVPSLHAQPVVARSAEAPPSPRRPPTWLWVGVGAALGLALAVTWMMVGRPDARVDSVAQSERPPSTAPAIAPAPAAPAPAVRAPVAPIESRPIAEPAPWPRPDERKAARTEATVPTLTAPSVPTLTAPTVGGPPADTPVVGRDQLPPHIRAELPAFAIGGSMYSTSPASRSLIVNGQLYRERDRLTADLTLEEIRQKAAIFSFRGHRFEVLF